jgi:hypothetical protein
MIQCPPDLASSNGGDLGSIHDFYGTVCGVGDAALQLALRGNRTLNVDTTGVFDQHRPILLTPGRPLHVRASIDAKGVVHAQRISVAHGILK